MIDDKGQRVKKATPSTPVEILGLNIHQRSGTLYDARADPPHRHAGAGCTNGYSGGFRFEVNRGRLPPSLAPLVRSPFTPRRHYRPFIFSIAGRVLSLPRRPEGWPPYVLPVDCCLPAGRRGRRPLQASLQAFRLFVGEGFIPPAPPRH